MQSRHCHHRAGARSSRGLACIYRSLSLLGAFASLLTIGEAAAAPVGAPIHSLHLVSGIERVAVFGTDDRIPLPPAQRSLENAIGLLYEQRSHSVCTAFCVGDDTVATAGHCIYRTSGERAPKLSGFTFRLTGKKSRTATRIAGTEAGSAAQHVTAGSMQLSIHPPIDASRDWALIKLAHPVCKGAKLTISRRPAKDLAKLTGTEHVYQVAFHRDFGNWQLAYGAPCTVHRSFGAADWNTISRDFADAEQLILHTCDTGGASSGSPLLIDGPSGPEVVGINVGTYVQSKVLLQNGEVVHRFQADTVANTGVSAAAFLDRLEAFARAEMLPSREKMRTLQTLLAERGYYSGPRDGAFGPIVRTAIESFEVSEGRPETGLATAALLRRLMVLKTELKAEMAGGRSPALQTGSLGSHVPTDGNGPVPRR